MTQRFEAFVLSISQIYQCIQKIKSHEMTELGLKGPHVMCLFQLRQAREGLTVTELSGVCLEDKAAVSRAVSKLEELGLVRFQENGGKRRYRSKIRLTQAGGQVAEKMMSIIERAVQKGGRGLTDPQREALYSALGIIARNLSDICTSEEFI